MYASSFLFPSDAFGVSRNGTPSVWRAQSPGAIPHHLDINNAQVIINMSCI